MPDNRRLTRRTALSLIAGGGLLTASETLGFTNVTGKRGVNVSTAEDAYALLGIDPEDDIGELTGNDGNVEVAALTNNLDEALEEIDVYIEEIPDADVGILTASADPRFDVSAGGTSSAEVACAEEENVGERDVRFGIDAHGSTVRVTDASFVVTIDIQCRKGSIEPTESGIELVFVSDMVSGEPDESQLYEFRLTTELSQEESVEIELAGVSTGQGIDYGDATFETESSGQLTHAEEGNSYVITFSATEAIEAGETVSISADGIDTTRQQATGTYDAVFSRSDFEVEEETSFDVS